MISGFGRIRSQNGWKGAMAIKLSLEDIAFGIYFFKRSIFYGEWVWVY